MKKLMMVLAMAALLVPAAALAQHDGHDHGHDMAMKAPTMKSAMVNQMKAAESELMELAEAMPADKYTWRPAEGVRSVAETYLHVAGANYMFPPMMGAKAADGVDAMGLEQSTTDKKKVMDTMKASFAYANAAIEAMPESDYGKTFKFFDGSDMSYLDGLMVMVSHGHEHLGQSIAYARMNGVVPPWTARQNAAEAEAKKNADKADE